MRKTVFGLVGMVILLVQVFAVSMWAQQRQDTSIEEDAYGSKFFAQLHLLFGLFQDADLQRAFREAKSIQCSELVEGKGEWRPVAFFNEDRKLGDWCKESIDQVKSDLEVYTFRGECSGNGRVEVTTEFPTTTSYEEYVQRKIELNQIDVTVNDPVKAVMNSKTMAYTFELPYLFQTSGGPRKAYSLTAPDRNTAYAADVTSRWECKAVYSKDLTYRFLICRVNTVPRRPLRRNETWDASFGSSAHFILSDGTEAKSSVNMTFGNESAEQPENAPASKIPERPKLKR
jgi:hypothetical protein